MSGTNTWEELAMLAAQIGGSAPERGLVRPTFPKSQPARRQAMLAYLRRELTPLTKPATRGRAKKPRPSGGPFVYFVRAGAAIKIGYAKDVRARMREIQVGCPHRLELLYAFRGTREHEVGLHRKYRKLKIHGEWFRAEETLLRHIDRLKLRAA